MATNWPVGLEQKLQTAGFQLTPGETRIASEVEIGPRKVRSRYTQGIDIYQGRINLDYDDVQTFLTFYKTTLANGTLPFTFTDPIYGTEATFRFSANGTPPITPLGNGGRIFSVTLIWEKVG